VLDLGQPEALEDRRNVVAKPAAQTLLEPVSTVKVDASARELTLDRAEAATTV
jgi:hypothetical protein